MNYPRLKRLAGLTDAEVAAAMRQELGDVRGISYYSVSLWSRGVQPVPWWAEDALARVCRSKAVASERRKPRANRDLRKVRKNCGRAVDRGRA